MNFSQLNMTIFLEYRIITCMNSPLRRSSTSVPLVQVPETKKTRSINTGFSPSSERVAVHNEVCNGAED